MSHRLRKSVSMVSFSAMPTTTTGTVPTMMYQPIRVSRSPRSSGRTIERSHDHAIRQMSCRK